MLSDSVVVAMEFMVVQDDRLTKVQLALIVEPCTVQLSRTNERSKYLVEPRPAHHGTAARPPADASARRRCFRAGDGDPGRVRAVRHRPPGHKAPPDARHFSSIASTSLQTGKPQSLVRLPRQGSGHREHGELLRVHEAVRRARGAVSQVQATADSSCSGFPSNDFGAQEPGSNKEIAEFCRTTYGVEFPMFEKSRAAPGSRATVLCGT